MMNRPMHELVGVYRRATTSTQLATRQVVPDPFVRRTGTPPTGHWVVKVDAFTRDVGTNPLTHHTVNQGGAFQPDGPPETLRRWFLAKGATPGWRAIHGPEALSSTVPGQDIPAGTRLLHRIKVRGLGAMLGQLVTLHLGVPANNFSPDGAPTDQLHAGVSQRVGAEWTWITADATALRAAGYDTVPQLVIGPSLDTSTTYAQLEIGAWSLIAQAEPDWPAEVVVDGNSAERWGTRFAWASNPLGSQTRFHRDLGTEVPGVMAITTERGGDATATVLEPTTGTANITLDGDRTRGNPITPQVHLRVVNKLTGESLFTGRVDSVTTDERLDPADPTGRRVTTHVRVADRIAEVANTMRYGVHPEGGAAETTLGRLHRLMGSAPGVPYRLDGTHPLAGDILHRAYVHDSDLAKHLQMLADGAMLGWCADQDGTLRFRPCTSPAVSTPAALNHPALFTDGTLTPNRPQVPVPYVGLVRRFDTTDLATVVTIKRYLRKADPDNPGEWLQRLDQYGPVVSNLAEVWGRRSVEVECAVTNEPGDPVADELLAEHYAGLRRPAARPRRVRLNPGLYGWPEGLDLLAVTEVAWNAERARVYVAGIRHTITPTSWVAELELADPGTYLTPVLEPLPDPKTPPGTDPPPLGGK